MAITQLDQTGKNVGEAQIPLVFERTPKLSVLHQAVIRHLANRRAGTADTKTRDEVAGGGRKPWRQKGTGRARHGSIRSPLWRTGGVVFGPHPRSFAIGMNKRARRQALAMAIAAQAQTGAVSVMDAALLNPTKTKDLAGVLLAGGKPGSLLFVVDAQRDSHAAAIHRAARNLPKVRVLPYTALSVHALLSHARVVFSKNALNALAEVCGG